MQNRGFSNSVNDLSRGKINKKVTVLVILFRKVAIFDIYKNANIKKKKKKKKKTKRNKAKQQQWTYTKYISLELSISISY